MSTAEKQVNTGWTSSQPVWSIGAVLVAVLVFAGLCWVQYAVLWSSLERYNAPIYAKTGFRAWHYKNSSADYDLIMLVDAHGKSRLALPDEIGIEPQPDGSLQYRWFDDSQTQGLRVEHSTWRFNDAVLHAELARLIYGGHTLIYYLKMPACVALAVLVVLLFFAGPLDRKRAIAQLLGRRMGGTEQVSVAGFNLRMKRRKKIGEKPLQNGVGFVDAGRSWLSRQLNLVISRGVYVPREREARFMVMAGDTGSGKTSAIRQVLHQVAERGELAVIYDPGGEYAKEFYDPAQGDILLNPLDARSPFYALADEIEDDAEAATVAASLFPDRPRDNPFFVEAARRLFAYLLCLRPTPEELVYWLSHPSEIDKRVRGTELEALLADKAPGQRNGVLASLNMVADALKLLPKEGEAKERFSTKAWAKQRRGWIFITSMPETRVALRPLISLWIDLLVLRIMRTGAASGQKTWFIVDELHSLQALPQLAMALTESRKANCVMVLGFQGRAQIVDLYGPLAETLLSQPATKLFFATTDPDAADWIMRAIGKVKYLRRRISQSQGQQGRDSESQQSEIVSEYPVMDSEIMGLEPLECYLKHGRYVVHFHTAYIEPEEKHPAFVPRERTSVRTQMQALQASEPSQTSYAAEPLAMASTTQQQHEFFE